MLDPLFWQALGKALGWPEKSEIETIAKDIRVEGQKSNADMRFYSIQTTWLGYALKYFDLVLTGGDTEKFWKELLS